MDLKTEVAKIITGEIKNDEESLTNYSKDASIYEVKPQLITYPKSVADIEKLIKFANDHLEEKISLTARAAGTCMSGGAINDSIILDMTKHFDQIVKVGEDFAITQPGVFYRDFEPQTLKHDLLLPCYTSSREQNTVGGMVGNNSAGEKTLSYGQTKDYVLELKVVFSDGHEYLVKPVSKSELTTKLSKSDFEGTLYKKIYQLVTQNAEAIQKAKPITSKNSTGYYLWEVWDGETFDLTKLIVGSQGTLGIITEIKFRLVQPKKFSQMLVIYLDNLNHLADIINKVLSHKPESFETYDDQTLKIATKFLPEVLQVIKPHNMISMALRFLPEEIQAFTHGFPKLILLAEFTGQSEEEVKQQALDTDLDLKSLNLKTHLTSDADESKKFWTIRRESFALLRRHAMHMRTAPFIDDIIVQPKDLPEFLPKLQKIMNSYKNDLVYTIAGHIGNGNFHIIPLMDFNLPRTPEVIKELMEKVFALVFKYHGSMAAEHNDGLVRGPFLKQMYGEKIFELFQTVKKIFDPNDIFNPHKKADATFEYSNAHLSHPHPDVIHGS